MEIMDATFRPLKRSREKMNRQFLAATAVALFAVSSVAAADVRVTHPFSSSREKGTVRRVIVEIPSGSVTVRNGDTQVLAVTGVASRDYEGSRERVWAQKVVNASSVDIYASGDEAIVRRKFGPDADSFRAQKFTSFSVTIDVPAGTDVEIRTSAGEVRMAGTFGRVSSDLRAGEIHFTAPKSSIRELNASCRVGEVHANLGDETIRREGLFPGRTHYYDANGTSTVDLHVTAGEIHVELTR
jgi:opacity protein-like surface antigen